MSGLNYQPQHPPHPLPKKPLAFIALAWAALIAAFMADDLPIGGSELIYLCIAFVVLSGFLGLMAWLTYRAFQRELYRVPKDEAGDEPGES